MPNSCIVFAFLTVAALCVTVVDYLEWISQGHPVERRSLWMAYLVITVAYGSHCVIEWLRERRGRMQRGGHPAVGHTQSPSDAYVVQVTTWDIGLALDADDAPYNSFPVVQMTTWDVPAIHDEAATAGMSEFSTADSICQQR